MIGAWSAGRLRGYVATAALESRGVGLRRARVLDLIALDDEPAVVDALLAAAYERARAARLHVFELFGFPAAIRERMRAGRPRSRRLPSWPYYYRALDPSLAERLNEPASWYACPYDGDGAIYGYVAGAYLAPATRPPPGAAPDQRREA